MTNSERITAHNARLAAMKETVAALPEAGGGGSVETCTVTISGYPETSGAYYSNGSEIVYFDGTLVPDTVLTVAKNSIIYIISPRYTVIGDVSITDGEVLHDNDAYATIAVYGDCVLTIF